ncbi:TetR family transcriptional regulator [Streptacidiphilus cavernicola]|uniref:TetR family transcriptional regulator n=1 Tax=Streptacidiphilus cavernicola TaxID=3342716 RepID=A0ABV6VRA5_9ACTN
METSTRRGPSPKGVARRAEILRVALDAYRTSGRYGPSLKSIADATGLSEAGVLHYFGSKDELLVQVLAADDARCAATYDLTTIDGFWELLAHTTRTPGLIRLLIDMTAAATDPGHPAHAFVDRRTRDWLALMERILGPGYDWEAQVLLAAADGLRFQWLRDPSTDIVGDLRSLHTALLSGPGVRSS